MVRVIGVPFDYCGRREGSRMGPTALRLAGLTPTLEQVVGKVEDLGDLPVGPLPAATPGLRAFATFYEVASRLKAEVRDALASEIVPVVLGGDHSLALGSVAAALEAYPETLGVLWIDAHADVNTPETSPSGNLHGMPLGALMGLPSPGSDQWARLLSEVVPPTRLRPEHVAWLGLRDLDVGEQMVLDRLTTEFVATMHDFDRHGMVDVMARLDRWMGGSKVRHLWVSFDVDCLDPVLAPGTGTAVRGGLTYREAHLCAELLREKLDAPDCPYRLVGLDLVETNPSLDTHNMTAVTVVEWVASLFGKTILGKR